MAQVTAVKNVTMQIKREMDAENQRLNRVHGNVFDDNGSGKGGGDPMAGLDDAALPVVRPGDASVAAPFTSRTPSVRSVVTLIRQGRCTLLSALQQQQIMMLECIISAYALSALSLEGARSSERQMMASGWLIMTASLAFSYTKGVEEMHPVRPLRKLFHPAVFLSMLGQAAIHVFCMGYGVAMAKEVMGPDALKAVVDFHKAARAKQLPEQQNSDQDPWAEMKAMWMTPFKPNLLNTVVFLVETSQMIAVLFVNYKGRPWMKGVLENHPLFLSVFLCVAGVAGCAWGIRPELNELIHLEAFPDDAFRWKVLGLVGLSIVGTFLWDRLILCLFAPDIFAAMVSEAKKTTLKDVTPILLTLAKVGAGFFVLATGNVLVLGLLGWWWYKNKKAAEIV
jgi:cation-transporting ATPase 13A1